MNQVIISRNDIEQFRQIISTWRRIPKEEIDDFVGDALLAFAKKSQRQQIAKPLNWLLSAAARLVRKLGTRSKRRIKCESIAFDPEFRPHEDAPPVAVLSLWRALDSLRPEYRAVIETCDLNESSPMDASSKLHRPYRTIQTHRRRAYQKLSRDAGLRSILNGKA